MTIEKPFLYLSYKGEEPEALALIERLRADGCRLWSDTRPNGGPDWADALGEHLMQCGMFLTLLTDEHLANNWCAKELLAAIGRGQDCPILAVSLTETPPRAGISLALADLRKLRRSAFDSDEALYQAVCAAKGMEAFFPSVPVSPDEIRTIQFQNGEYHGGTLDGAQHGEGVCRYDDGRVYTGQWNRGLRHGKGTMTWPSGMRYAGDWENDRISGEGRLDYPPTDREGRVCHEGSWKNGMPFGPGTLTMHDGSHRSGMWHGSRLTASADDN